MHFISTILLLKTLLHLKKWMILFCLNMICIKHTPIMWKLNCHFYQLGLDWRPILAKVKWSLKTIASIPNSKLKNWLFGSRPLDNFSFLILKMYCYRLSLNLVSTKLFFNCILCARTVNLFPNFLLVPMETIWFKLLAKIIG